MGGALLKRAVYGVDLNLMAVELAKVSQWLLELNAKTKQALLSDSEERELSQLVDRAEAYMLVHAQALMLLKEREQDA